MRKPGLILRVAIVFAACALAVIFTSLNIEVRYSDANFGVVMLPYEIAEAALVFVLWVILLRHRVPLHMRRIVFKKNLVTGLLILFPLAGWLASVYASQGLESKRTFVLLVTTLLVGFFEELLTRGILLGAFRRSGMAATKAVFLSAGIFSTLHLVNLLTGLGVEVVFQLLNTFLLGTILGYIYLKTENIAYVMIIHGIWDFVNLARPNTTDERVVAVVFVASVILTVVMFIWAVHSMIRQKEIGESAF
jgi:membrane protease YdiL (CAAX protease family)